MATRKQRVRGHVIADLSFHYLAYQVAKRGFTIEAVQKDYGYDATIVTYDLNGEVENGLIYIQLKASDTAVRNASGSDVLYEIKKTDVHLWQEQPYPLYLVLFDSISERAYWLYLQQYLQRNHIVASAIVGRTLPVPISKSECN
jgi:hypothetical protein